MTAKEYVKTAGFVRDSAMRIKGHIKRKSLENGFKKELKNRMAPNHPKSVSRVIMHTKNTVMAKLKGK